MSFIIFCMRVSGLRHNRSSTPAPCLAGLAPWITLLHMHLFHLPLVLPRLWPVRVLIHPDLISMPRFASMLCVRLKRPPHDQDQIIPFFLLSRRPVTTLPIWSRQLCRVNIWLSLSFEYEILLFFVRCFLWQLFVSIPGVISWCAHSSTELCWANNAGTSDFPCSFPSNCGCLSSFLYACAETPDSVLTCFSVLPTHTAHTTLAMSEFSSQFYSAAYTFSYKSSTLSTHAL